MSIMSDVDHKSETISISPIGLPGDPSRPAVAPDTAASGDLPPCARVLEREMRDLDGRLLRAGTPVLANDVAPDEVMEDTPANRRAFAEGGYAWSAAARAKLWFPPAVSEGLAREPFTAVEVAKQRFLAAIAENLAHAQYETFPQINLPLAMRALPWEPRVWRVREVADLTADLAGLFRDASGVPTHVAWPSEAQGLFDRLHGARVFELASLLGSIHVVVAFVCPLTLGPGKPPEIRSPGAAAIELVRSAYERWNNRDSSKRPLHVFVSVGSYVRWDIDVKGLADDRTWVMCSHLQGGTWVSATPPTLSERLAVRQFVDRLKPETRGDRIGRIRVFVDRELDEGSERVTIKYVKEKLDRSLRRGAITDAFFALQDLKHYRVTKTGDGLLAIDRHVEWTDQRVTRADLGVSLLRSSLATILSFALILVPKALYDVFSGNSLNWRSYLVFVLISAFVGPYTDKIRGRLRERRDKD